MFVRIISILFLVAALFGCQTINPVTQLDKPENLKALVQEEGVVVLTVFGADWCGYCQAFDKEIPRLQEKYGKDLKIVKVDADKYPMSMFGIPADGIPFFAVSIGGKLVSMGGGTVEDVESVLDEAVSLLKGETDGQTKGH